MWRAIFCVCPGPQRFPLVGLLMLGILVLIVIPRGELMAQPQAPVRAPEFPEGMQWLNTDKPLRLADLRGVEKLSMSPGVVLSVRRTEILA